MSENRATDYSISTSDAKDLLGAVGLPHEFRKMVLKMHVKEKGVDSIINLFSQFIGLSNSVVENTKESLAIFGICKMDWAPYQAERINMPSLFGALNGVTLANEVDQSKTCEGCACRIGTLANQSPSTTCDVQWCIGDEEKFFCHEHLDDKGQPTRKCIGFLQIAKHNISTTTPPPHKQSEE